MKVSFLPPPCIAAVADSTPLAEIWTGRHLCLYDLRHLEINITMEHFQCSISKTYHLSLDWKLKIYNIQFTRCTTIYHSQFEMKYMDWTTFRPLRSSTSQDYNIQGISNFKYGLEVSYNLPNCKIKIYYFWFTSTYKKK